MINYMSQHHDKLLLLLWFAFASFVLLHVLHHDQGNPIGVRIIDFLLAQLAGISGALLTLITGARLVSRNGDNKDKPKTEPSANA